MPQLIVIGAGIVGLAHAALGLLRGWSVRVIERDPEPRGASTQNFGMVWPIGQALGATRERALRSRQIWEEMSRLAGFSLDPCGTLLLAYTAEAEDTLHEFLQQVTDRTSFTLLEPSTIARTHPAVRTDGLKAGLFSASEARVAPVKTLQALIRWLQREGVAFHFGRPAVKVHSGAVETSDGRTHPFDRLVICNGEDTRTLYPTMLDAAGCTRIRLQMMQTTPAPANWRLFPALASELSMAFYASFAGCPSTARLKARLQTSHPHHLAQGIHVLAVQDASGALILGDSHTDDQMTPASYRSDIEGWVLEELNRFLKIPEVDIATRWLGHYLRPPAGLVLTRFTPAMEVDIVTGLGGAGMTLSFALAEETLDRLANSAYS